MKKTKELKNKQTNKKTGDTKGNFHAKMGTIKDRNGLHLTEAEYIKKNGKECTTELHKRRS